MAVLHLVTGYQGAAHVTSADQGLLNAGCFGLGEYVLGIGNRFEAQIISNNVVRIKDGTLLMQGRQINLERDTFLDANISNGTQSQYRNDLIVMRYIKDQSTGVESAAIAVINGTSTTGTPTDPAYNTASILDDAAVHDMPLYRVRLSGLSIESVEPMFTMLAPLGDIQHSFYKQNMLLNGDFQCNQRKKKTYDAGATAAYSVDMWRAYQVKVEVLNEGIKLTGKSATTQGYFTQFIQLGKLKTTPYTVSAMVDGEICTFTETPGANAKEKNFGKFKITMLTTSVWDNDLNDYNNKLKINICPVGTSTFTMTYIDVFEGDMVYPHVKEDMATAMIRCRRYIQYNAYSTPTLYLYTENSKYAYRFAVTHDHMASVPTLEECSWSYYNTAGESTTGTVTEVTVVGNGNNIIQLRTAYKEQKNAQCNAIRGVYLVTCEPTDP